MSLIATINLLLLSLLLLLVSVYEVLPKDKRAKEEKTQMLGISHLDLLPIIQGTTIILYVSIGFISLHFFLSFPPSLPPSLLPSLPPSLPLSFSPFLLPIKGQCHLEQTLYLQPLSTAATATTTPPVTENLPEVDIVVNVGKGVFLLPDDISNRYSTAYNYYSIQNFPPTIIYTYCTCKH